MRIQNRVLLSIVLAAITVVGLPSPGSAQDAAGIAVGAAEPETDVPVAEPRCPLIPMGAITGKPDEQTVRETLEAYKAVSF